MTPRKIIYVAGHLVGIFAAAWCFYNRQWKEGMALLTGVGVLRFDPPEGAPKPDRLSSTLPIMCLAVLAFGACDRAGGPFDFCAGLHIKSEGRAAEAKYAPLAQGVNANYLRMVAPLAAVPAECTGYACIYTRSSDSLIRLVDAAGNERIMGETSRLRSSAGTPADVALTWLWYDSGTDEVVARLSTGNATITGAGGNVSIGGTQTITGAKTFSAAAVFNGAVTLGDAIADIIGIKGALRVYNTAGTFYSEITPGATANRAVTLPDAAGAIVLDSATQTLTNKSIVATQLTGDIAIARMSTALGAPGAIGGGTPAAGTFTALAANTSLTVAGAPTAATFFRTCTITSAAAATPVNCLAAADVPAALSAKLAKWHAYVNGAVAWATTATCTIEDTAGNDLVVMSVTALTADTFVDDGSASIVKEARYRLGTGGAVDEGLQIVCNANGTGSDLVVVVSGSIQ
jgi:hypothetical protein